MKWIFFVAVAWNICVIIFVKELSVFSGVAGWIGVLFMHFKYEALRKTAFKMKEAADRYIKRIEGAKGEIHNHISKLIDEQNS
jgi:hypothetical protein